MLPGLSVNRDIELDEHRHVYRVGGIVRPSVTQALKEAGLIDTHWYTEEARLRGKAAHVACQFLDEDDLDWESVLAPYRGFVQGWAKFKRDSGFQIGRDGEGRLLVEYRVYHPLFGYCGTLDRQGTIGSTDYVIDLKTGAAEDWHGYQLAGYSQCFPNPLARKRLTVHLKANGCYTTREYGLDRFAYDWQVFSASVVIWQAKNKKRRFDSNAESNTVSAARY
jgi:hypothetical protein